MYFNHDDKSVMLSWDELQQATEFLITNDLYDLDSVVGISRGGLAPALILSQQLDVPLVTIEYSAHDDSSNPIPYQQLQQFDNKSVLFVDDISDNGYTLNNLKQACDQNFNISLTTATLVYKPHSVYKPDRVAVKLPATSGWVVFPYELEVRTFDTKRSHWTPLMKKLSAG